MQLPDLLTTHFRLTQQQKAALGRLGITTVRDLLYHFPNRYEAGGGESSTSGLLAGQEVSIVGTLEKMETKRSWKNKIPISQGYLRDQNGRIALTWFNQPYIAKMYMDGTLVRATGRVSGKDKKIYLANPQLEKVSVAEAGLFKKERPFDWKGQSFETTQLFAVYAESQGTSSLWMRHALHKLFTEGALEGVEDPLPEGLLKSYHLPGLKAALAWIHQPKDLKQAEAARKRFAFEEVFMIQLERQREKLRESREKSFAVDIGDPEKGRTLPKEIQKFIESFPFEATRAQEKAIDAILKDMRSGHPMSRLLEGDVGSGKTAVAAAAAYAAVRTRPEKQTFGTLQVAYMAPTEILAKQHFESFIEIFNYFPINIGLITGSGCYKFPSKINREKYTGISRAQLLKWVRGGEIPILIGTHALIEKTVAFKHLALVIIDEQHRFGTNQRRKLAKKEARLPHLLSMTATPIPRTLALTLYGDLDLTLLDEMPAGRKPIITEVVAPRERYKAYAKILTQLQAGRQAYVICPRIDEPDPQKEWALQAKSVKAEAKRLKTSVFPDYEIGILHSKMTPKEKDETMARFAAGEIDVLVATSVVEVGVNVPNATVMLIEGAERFGLSQLHQLRGRVVRSIHQAYCFAVPETQGASALTRLKALISAKSGFELAEADLMQRGPGELSGRKQWGISDVGMEALKNLKLVEAARKEALQLVQKDEELKQHPRLAQELKNRTAQMHFE